MKTKRLGLAALGLLVSSSAFATSYNVTQWSECIQFVDPFQGLTRWFVCREDGKTDAPSCDGAYNQLHDSIKCCESAGGALHRQHQMNCTVAQ